MAKREGGRKKGKTIAALPFSLPSSPFAAYETSARSASGIGTDFPVAVSIQTILAEP